jgi:hypothetical protein
VKSRVLEEITTTAVVSSVDGVDVTPFLQARERGADVDR